MNNLILCNIPWYSGLAKFALDVANVFLKRGEKVFWALEEKTVLSGKISAYPFGKIPQTSRKNLNFFKNLTSIKSALPKEPFRILSFTGSGLFLGYLLKRKYGSKLYRFRTESYEVKKNVFNRFLYSRCDGIFAGNKKIAGEISSFTGKKVDVLYAGVDTEKFCFSPLPEKRVVGYVGRIDEIKGLEVLAEAMNKVWGKFPSVSLRIAGPLTKGYSWQDLKKKFSGNVFYAGALLEEEVPQFMGECLFGVVPSLGSEATSRVLLEWMSCGRAVVASRVGMLEEVVEEGETGFLIPPGDAEALAEKICLTLEGEFPATMSHKARRKIENGFSLEIFEKHLLEKISSYET